MDRIAKFLEGLPKLHIVIRVLTILLSFLLNFFPKNYNNFKDIEKTIKMFTTKGNRSGDLASRVASLASDRGAASLANSYGLAIQTVSWEDTARFKESCWGPNISDMTLRAGERNMPVIRRPNFADVTADISSDKFNVRVGNEKGTTLEKVSFPDYVKGLKGYTGNSNLGEMWLPRDEKLLLSSQCCVLPLDKGEVDFCVQLYNYQSSEQDPGVLVIVATNEGTSCQIISGQTKLYMNDNDVAKSFLAKRLKDDRKERGVKLEGKITDEERARNVIYIYQIPLKRKARSGGLSFMMMDDSDSDLECAYACSSNAIMKSMRTIGDTRSLSRGFDHATIRKGESHGKYTGTKDMTLERDHDYPIRLTLQYYHVTDTADITEDYIKMISEELEKSYTFGENKSSLVCGVTKRTKRQTDPTLPEDKKMYIPEPILLSGCV